MGLNLTYISNRREELKIPMQQMAHDLGFKNASTYFNYEKGNYRFKADQLPILADILKCKIADFFTKDVAKSANGQQEVS